MSSLQLSQLPAITARAERCPVRGLAGIKPPERSCYRSQLSLRVLRFNEDKRLGMPRAALRPPSKPVWVCPVQLWIHCTVIQGSRDQRLFDSYPELIAVFHALQSLLTPRHPPYALSNLTTKIKRSSRTRIR
jgi:hypothetical protein